MAWIRHDSHAEAVIKNRQALGAASPIETDADGYAEVSDDETAERLAALDTHVDQSDAPSEADTDDEDDASESDEPEAFDAESFVDRTPMSEVVEDIESGEYDDHLDEIEAAADRKGVRDAVSSRRE